MSYRGWEIEERDNGAMIATQEKNRDKLGVKANWAQASNPVLVLDADEEWKFHRSGKQVADFRHDREAAIEEEIDYYEDYSD